MIEDISDDGMIITVIGKRGFYVRGAFVNYECHRIERWIECAKKRCDEFNDALYPRGLSSAYNKVLSFLKESGVEFLDMGHAVIDDVIYRRACYPVSDGVMHLTVGLYQGPDGPVVLIVRVKTDSMHWSESDG